jgi:Coenzyme PQQ synthesis protein D (PqqD)
MGETVERGAAVDWQMRLRLAAGVELSEVTDGFVVYHPDRDRVHYLNRTAALLLTLCDGATPAAALPAFLARSFHLPEPPRDEVAECLAKFLAEGLIEGVDEAAPPSAGGAGGSGIAPQG